VFFVNFIEGFRPSLTPGRMAAILKTPRVFGQAFGKGDLLAGHGKLSAYWTRVQADPVVQKVLGEMQEGLASFGRR
jgi:hypothetical protein